MEMVRMSSDLRFKKKDVELSQAAYLKFHSVFNAPLEGLLRSRGAGNPPRGEMMEGIPVRLLRSKSSLTLLFQRGELLSSAKEGRGGLSIRPIIYS